MVLYPISSYFTVIRKSKVNIIQVSAGAKHWAKNKLEALLIISLRVAASCCIGQFTAQYFYSRPSNGRDYATVLRRMSVVCNVCMLVVAKRCVLEQKVGLLRTYWIWKSCSH